MTSITRALEVARVCYGEIERWPSPWPPAARRSSVSGELRKGSPRRVDPRSVAGEIAALEQAQAAPLAERPWLLAELHGGKLKSEWAAGVVAGDLPNLDRPATLSLRCGEGIPELGAVLAVGVWTLRSDFVEATGFTEADRVSVARELIDRLPRGARQAAGYLRSELERAFDPVRKASIRMTLELIDPAR